MSRLEIFSQNRSQIIIEELYENLQHRIEASPPGLCPVYITRAFIEMCHAQTCGKCAPCRIGLLQLKHILTDVLNGKSTMKTLDLIEETAKSIRETADCALGYEAADMVYKSIIYCRDDFEEHIKHGRCGCMTTQPVPCVALCPANVDIPGYIALVRDERYADAVRLIRKDNPFPSTCAFICEHPCEHRCRRNMVDSAINIRGLKRVAVEFSGKVPPPPCAPSTGKTIAIVGGGPAGLTAAYYLQLMGHQTTVYEMLPKLGGMLRYGIPNYRLPKDRLDEDIDAILETGVKVVYGKKIGTDIELNELIKDNDAAIIAIGASTDKKLGLEGEDSEGVISAVQFLRDVGMDKGMDLTGKKTAIIGGGNVAMDAVRTAVRLKSEKVTCLYRRRVADMTALPAEIEGALAEGVEMMTLKAPSKLEVKNGKLTGVWVTPQMISKIKDGRASVVSTGEPDIFIPCEVLVVAIGQDIETQHYEDSGIPVDRGKLFTMPSASFQGMPGLFSGGDCASGPATVIKAIAAGKVMAANIDEYLGYSHTISCDIEIPIPNIDDRLACGRVELGEREASERIKDFEGVEFCMSKKEACQESNRCLKCDHFGFGIFKGGRERLW
ncbi:FAD-dependent oxidoreductase [Treponema denticola]|uniref:NAD(P)-binding protein n=1 Tax=Treponema denticola TaxID=158 RepID=UPI0020A49885|nr:NAD(P)-binding protein [Treponema denticola]UTC92659.1 FAD-dependent oxidoreductase [Treponema denticola]UTC97719.1 FAD-dependent oxidoreductase [Treponema denticola]